MCYWKAKDEEDHGKMPCLIDLKETCIFGLPTAEYPGLMKVCIVHDYEMVRKIKLLKDLPTLRAERLSERCRT